MRKLFTGRFRKILLEMEVAYPETALPANPIFSSVPGTVSPTGFSLSAFRQPSSEPVLFLAFQMSRLADDPSFFYPASYSGTLRDNKKIGDILQLCIERKHAFSLSVLQKRTTEIFEIIRKQSRPSKALKPRLGAFSRRL